MTSPHFWRRCGILLLLLVFSGFIVTASDSMDASTRKYFALAKESYLKARERWLNSPEDIEVGWTFGKACFELAEYPQASDEIERVATEGIAACRKVVARDNKLAAGHYYLAMNLGQLARTKSIGALKLLGEMEHEYQAALELNAKIDFGGPDRNLGMIYHEAPGWPVSIGNHKKAREHLEHAKLLSPEYPENRIYLMEALLKWGDKKAAQKEYKEIAEHWLEMKTQFAGDRWAHDWIDWDQRWKRIQEKMEESGRPGRTENRGRH